MRYEDPTLRAEAQEMLDRAVRGVVAQGVKARRVYSAGHVGCTYLTENGDRCAFGQLISDALLPVVKMIEDEGDGTADLVVSKLTDEVLGEQDDRVLACRDEIALYGRHTHFLRLLQKAHDDADNDGFVESFIRRARRVAHDFGLEFRT